MHHKCVKTVRVNTVAIAGHDIATVTRACCDTCADSTAGPRIKAVLKLVCFVVRCSAVMLDTRVQTLQISVSSDP